MMTTSLEQVGVDKVPAIFNYGFRPFFFFGALWAALAVPLWIATFVFGDTGLPFETGMVWHAHEMIFGYSSAIIAGFLLTAVPSWTGRPPITGVPLMGLVLLWFFGRLGLLIAPDPFWIGPILDSLFLVVFSIIIFREVIAGKNKRNAKIAIILSLLALANIGFHISQTIGWVSFDRMIKMGLGILLLLIVIVGGRVTPSFTNSWLKNRSDTGAIAFNRFDMITMAVSAVSILAWVAFPFALFSGVLLVLASILNLIRLIRWKFWATLAEPLVFILHLGYCWAVAAFFLNGAATLNPEMFPPLSGIHAIGTGAVGVMTLAIMTRATLGHTGRQLRADAGTVFIYIFINMAAFSRVVTPFLAPDSQSLLTAVAAVFWILAFGLYCLIYGRYLWHPRLAIN
jgi:uncharacterized protein involved in response to NO